MALAARRPAKVIAADGVLRDRPGFEVELITRGSLAETPYASARHEVLMTMRGHWRLSWDGGETVLAPGDICAVPPGLRHALAPSMTGEVSLYRVTNTDDPAGATGRLLGDA
jgi:mannose-6-phosphate isomerase-like protein (cupin superfamily)